MVAAQRDDAGARLDDGHGARRPHRPLLAAKSASLAGGRRRELSHSVTNVIRCGAIGYGHTLQNFPRNTLRGVRYSADNQPLALVRPAVIYICKRQQLPNVNGSSHL